MDNVVTLGEIFAKAQDSLTPSFNSVQFEADVDNLSKSETENLLGTIQAEILKGGDYDMLTEMRSIALDHITDLEKAWNIGDEKQYQGQTYYVGGFNAKGQPLWRKKKDGGVSDKKAGASNTDSSQIVIDKMKKTLTSSLSKKKAIEDALKNRAATGSKVKVEAKKYSDMDIKDAENALLKQKVVITKQFKNKDTDDVFTGTIREIKSGTDNKGKPYLFARIIGYQKGGTYTVTQNIRLSKVDNGGYTDSLGWHYKIELPDKKSDSDLDPRDKIAEDAGFKDYEEMKGYQDYVTQKNLLKKKSTKSGVRLLYENEVSKYEKDHADLIKRIGINNKK